MCIRDRIIPGAVTVMVFFLIFRYLRQRRLDRYHVIEHSIDKGVVLPDSFYMAESNKNTNTPRSAIVWIGGGIAPVSYTHLDVYKRQEQGILVREAEIKRAVVGPCSHATVGVSGVFVFVCS